MFVYHIFGILISVVAAMLLGALWYSPLMFGKQWQHLVGFTHEQKEKAKAKGMAHVYALAFVLALVQTFIVYILFLTGFELIGIFAIWIGFALPVFANDVLWEGRHWKLFFIKAGCNLVTVAFIYEILRIFLMVTVGY